jgi:hypothetical protein
MAVMVVVNKMGLLRVSKEGEEYGLDLHEHGISAYPEYLITSAGRPTGMPIDDARHGAVHSSTAPSTARVSLADQPL